MASTPPPTPGVAPAAESGAWADAHLRVRYAETDAQGVVYHANYLVFMEVGRAALARERGLPYSELEARGVNLLVARAELKYKASARYDDPLVVSTRVREVRGTFVTFEYRIVHGESGRLLVTGETAHVCVNGDFKPMAVPSWVGEVLMGATNPPVGGSGDAPAGAALDAPAGADRLKER